MSTESSGGHDLLGHQPGRRIVAALEPRRHRDGIVSDDPTDGRLITLSNEALWKFGSVEFTKFILDADGKPVRAPEADLPDSATFEVRIDGIDPALPRWN